MKQHRVVRYQASSEVQYTLLLAARIHRVYYGGFEWSFPGTYVNFQMLKIVRNIHMGLGFIPWEAVPTTLASTWDGCCDTGLVTWIHSPDCQPPTRRASSPCPDPKSRSPDTRFLNRRVGVTKQNWVYQDLNPRRNNQLTIVTCKDRNYSVLVEPSIHKS